MNIVNYVLFFFLVGFLMIGSQIYQLDQSLGTQRDIYNYTESVINIPTMNLSEFHPIQQTQGIINEGRLYLIIDSMINFILVSTEQIVKMGIEYGYQNPHLDWELIFYYLKIILILILIALVIKPLGYIFIFLIMSIIFIRDYIKSITKKRKNKIKEVIDNDR